jgi:hypothetical protein
MGFFPVPLAQRNAQFAADLELKQQQALQDQQDARAAALLKPLLNQYGPDAAKAIGSAWMAGGPASQVATQRLNQATLQANPAMAAPPEIGAPSFNDFTPDSMATYQKSGDPRVLQYRADPRAEARLQIARDAEDRKRLMSGRLPQGQVESMIQNELVDAGLDSTAQGMKPEYFGFKSDAWGNAVQEYKARTGTSGEDNQFTGFWNEVDSNQAIRRHALFGATLTEGENTAWQKIAIKPSDTYESAVAKLGAQKRLVAQKRTVQDRVLQGQGYQTPQQRPPLSQIYGQ